MSWDIFCNVIDNYGDIGVSWRLARQLANEHGQHVRLWVDDLQSFLRINPEAEIVQVQHSKGVEVRQWISPFPDVSPHDVVIESFGCQLPENFVERMKEKKPVWINLEYLSAEEWVKDCHLMPSPRPPLTKYFFFPGFVGETGGLMLERDLFKERDAFDRSAFWAKRDIDPEESLKISLFCYENKALQSLFSAWENGNERILCLLPEGKIASRVGSFSKKNLEVRVIPFVSQEEYDHLLWACDINFVRGEDSFVRGQWALKPFVWQIYPQEEEAHVKKLEAFLSLYCSGLDGSAQDAVRGMFGAWNGKGNVRRCWDAFLDARHVIEMHDRNWANEISRYNLARNLVDFSQRAG